MENWMEALDSAVRTNVWEKQIYRKPIRRNLLKANFRLSFWELWIPCGIRTSSLHVAGKDSQRPRSLPLQTWVCEPWERYLERPLLLESCFLGPALETKTSGNLWQCWGPCLRFFPKLSLVRNHHWKSFTIPLLVASVNFCKKNEIVFWGDHTKEYIYILY